MASQSLLEVLEYDDSLPIEKEVLDYWLADMKHPLRMGLLPVVRMVCSIQLHLTYFFKALASLSVQRPSFFTRLDLLVHEMVDHAGGQRADIEALQFTESNIINFLIANTQGAKVAPLKLYPKRSVT